MSTSIYDFEAQHMNGQSVPLAQYQGKVLLIVNTASACGFTPQFGGLQALHKQYADRGLVVLGFPCRQFLWQEKKQESAITEFCSINYGVSFPMFDKTSVAKGKANPFYAKLAKATGTAPGWNFHKYLVDRSGTKALSFNTQVEPSNQKLVAEIERLLAEKGDSK